jgi:hypothetical protein
MQSLERDTLLPKEEAAKEVAGTKAGVSSPADEADSKRPPM